MDISLELTDDSAIIVKLSGRFDHTTNLAFRQTTKPLLSERGVNDIVIDFADVPFIDSSALGMLLLMRAEAADMHKAVVLRHCGPSLLRILSVAQLHLIFRIEP